MDGHRHLSPQPHPRLQHIVLAAAIAAGLLGATGWLGTPRAAAGGYVGHWPYHWVAGGYQDYRGLGVQAILSPFVPTVPDADSQSLGRIAAVSADGNHAIELGWAVAPWAYGDSLPHLHVALRWYDSSINGFDYCNDAYAALQTFCGWVQVSATDTLGMALTPGTLYSFKLVYYSGYGGSWAVWLDSELVGYIPATQWQLGFTQMGRAEWFGEVDAEAAPTCADMGNGLYGTQPGAAQMNWLAVLDGSWVWHSAAASSHATVPRLYQVGAFTGASFAYGGPGAC